MIYILAFLVGILFRTILPIPFISLLGLGPLALIHYKLTSRKFFFILFFILILGFTWAQVVLQHEDTLPKIANGKMLRTIGIITSIPEQADEKTHFNFLVSKINDKHIKPLLVKISWHYPPPDLHVGDEWKLQIGLQNIHSTVNPGSFNYEQWAVGHRIMASGFVLPAAEYEKKESHWLRFCIARLRENIALQITKLIPHSYASFLTAFTVGLRSGITSTQWQTLQTTGTNHLIAIAGLHIGFLITFVMWFSYFIWRRNKKLALHFPAPVVAACVTLFCASAYSALAGFALPTVRALLMLSIFLLGIIYRWHITVNAAYRYTLLLVLLINPLIVLDNSFWLSFGSVALILYGTQGRVRQHVNVLEGIKLQWLLTVGLIPFTILFFQQISGASFLSNAVAIPVVGWIILPLCLSGVLFLKVTYLSHFLFYYADFVFSWLWKFLEKMAHFPELQFHIAAPSLTATLAMLIGTVLLLAPRGFPAKHLSVIWWLPLIVNYFPLANKEMKISIFDVEKGQSILIQTAHHRLLFDTGTSFANNSDITKDVIIPFLRIEKINSLDTFVVSSNNKSFYAGAQSLVNYLPIKTIVTSAPHLFANGPITACNSDQHWEWDQFKFQIIYPPAASTPEDKSPTCVLLVTTPNAENYLITGDLSSVGYKNLLASKLPTTFTFITAHVGITSRSLQNFIINTPVNKVILSGKPFSKKFHSLIPAHDTYNNGMISIHTFAKRKARVNFYRDKLAKFEK